MIEIFFQDLLSEPLKLSLNYTHDFVILKEQKATDSYLTLDEDIRECQRENTDDCNTRKYQDALITKCQCLPFQLISHADKAIQI